MFYVFEIGDPSCEWEKEQIIFSTDVHRKRVLVFHSR